MSENQLMCLALIFLLAMGQASPPEEIFNQAIQAQQRGDFEQAIAAYRELLKQQPKSFEAHANLGAALAHVGRMDEAIGEYRAALKLNPGNTAVAGNLALASYKKGDFASAAAEFEKLLKRDPGNLRLAILAGDSETRAGHARRAVEILQPLEAAHAEDLDLAYALGSAEIQSENVSAGAALVERAAKGKASAEAWFEAGSARLKNYEFPVAKDDLEACVKLDPKFPRAYTLLGIAIEEGGDDRAAEANLRKALELDPNDFQANLHLGGLLYSRRDLTAARSFIEKAHDLDPSSAFAAYEGALLEKAEGNLDKARIALEQIVAHDPKWLQPHVELASLYYKLHREEDGARERAIVNKLSAEEQKDVPERRDPLAR